MEYVERNDYRWHEHGRESRSTTDSGSTTSTYSEFDINNPFRHTQDSVIHGYESENYLSGPSNWIQRAPQVWHEVPTHYEPQGGLKSPQRGEPPAVRYFLPPIINPSPSPYHHVYPQQSVITREEECGEESSNGAPFNAYSPALSSVPTPPIPSTSSSFANYFWSKTNQALSSDELQYRVHRNGKERKPFTAPTIFANGVTPDVVLTGEEDTADLKQFPVNEEDIYLIIEVSGFNKSL